MQILKKRQIQILKKLYYSIAPIKVDELCVVFSVSLRTIRYDMRQIKTFLESIDVTLINKSGNGYYIKNSEKGNLLYVFDNKYDPLEDEEKEKRMQIVLYELSVKSVPVSSVYLSKLMFLSESSVSKCIHDFNVKLEKAKVKIKSMQSGYLLAGSEERIREVLTEPLLKLISNNYNSLDYYNLLPKQIQQEITKLRYRNMITTIDNLNQKYNVWLSQHMFVNLVVYMIVMELRVQNLHLIQNNVLCDFNLLKSEKLYVEELFDKLYDFEENSTQEVAYFIRFLVKVGIFIQNNDAKANVISEKIVDSMIGYLKAKEYPMNYEVLANDLKRHISVSIKWQQTKFIREDNALLSQIKSKYQSYYQLAKQLKNEVVNELKYEYIVDENELSYFTIYLYKNSLDRDMINSFKVYIVCASSRGVSKFLETRINHLFPQICVLGTLSINNLIQKKNYDSADLIISTIPLKNVSIPVIHVTHLLNTKDIEQIQNVVNYGMSSNIIPNTNRSSIDEFVKKQIEYYGSDINISVGQLSKVMLFMLDVLLSFDIQYHVTDQKILGVFIHLVLAIPRWVNNEVIDENVDRKLLNDIKIEYPEVYDKMNLIFEFIESEFVVELNNSEKISFFDYIIVR